MELDLHIHTEYSYDSIMKPKKIVKAAKKKALDGIAITDHGTIEGGLYARRYCSDNFIVMIGTEIKTEFGDVIGLFLNEEIKSDVIRDTIDEIHDQGGLVVLPHPFRGHNLDGFDRDLINKIDAIEGYNARTAPEKNIRAQEFARANKLPITAGSDAHFYSEIGLGRTIIENASSEEEVRKSILSQDTLIIGMQAPPYLRGASRMLGDIKKGKWYMLPRTLFSISFRGMKKLKVWKR